MHSILRLFRRSFFVGFCVCVCSLSLPFLGCHWTRLLFVLFVFLHSLKPFVRLIVMDDRWLQSLSASLMLNFVEHVFNFIGRLYDPIFRFVDALHMIPLIPCTIFSLSLSIPISIDFVRQMQEIRWFLRWNWVIYFAYCQKKAIFGIVWWLPTQWYDDLVSPHHHHHQLQPTPSKYSKSISIAPKKVQFHLKIPILFLSLVKLFFFTWFCSGDFLSITFNRFNAHILRI